jgi:hypothetical protein
MADDQLTEADVKRMWAEGKYEQIVDAQKAGRLRDVLAGEGKRAEQ